MAQALEQTRDLMRGLESLEHRMWQEAEPGADGQPSGGQEPQDGQAEGAGQEAGGEPSADGLADGQPGLGDTFGNPFGPGGWGDQRPGSYHFDPQDIRQWQRELQERLTDAQDIRRLLEPENFPAGELDEIIQRMREFDDPRVYQDAAVLAGLQSLLLENLKRFEYRLRREVDTENEQLFLALSEDVPPGFRELIEEYYRSLSQQDQ